MAGQTGTVAPNSPTLIISAHLQPLGYTQLLSANLPKLSLLLHKFTTYTRLFLCR